MNGKMILPNDPLQFLLHYKVIDLESAVDVANALDGALSYLSNAKVKGEMRKTVRVSSTDSRFIMDDPNELSGFPFLNTNNVPSDLTKGIGTALSAMIFGNFNDLLIGHWGAVDVLVDPFSLSSQGATRMTIFNDIDVAVRHAESFAAIQDIVTA